MLIDQHFYVMMIPDSKGGAMLKRFEIFILSIHQIYRCIQKIKSQEMIALGLKGTHVMCLFHLNQKEEGLTSAELVILCLEDKAAISRAIRDLSQKGLLTFADSSPQKRYRAKLKLTLEGRRIADKMLVLIEDMVTKGGLGLTEEERSIFYKALDTISHNLNNLCLQKGEA